MKIASQSEILLVSELEELGAANANAFRDEVRGALTDEHQKIEIDLSDTTFVDSSGLGALISLLKSMNNRGGQVRLLSPTPPVEQILELTRMHRLFEVVKK